MDIFYRRHFSPCEHRSLIRTRGRFLLKLAWKPVFHVLHFVMKFGLFQCVFLHMRLKRGIKHDFPFINIRKVPREVLKTEGEARGFQPSRGTLLMLTNDKIMLDRYYCIQQTIAKMKKKKKHWRTIFYNLITFFNASTLFKNHA